MHDAREQVDSNLCCWSADETIGALGSAQSITQHGSKVASGARCSASRSRFFLPHLHQLASLLTFLLPLAALTPMARNTPLHADITDSALHCRSREVVNEEAWSNRDRVGVAPNCLEPVKGTSSSGNALDRTGQSATRTFG